MPGPDPSSPANTPFRRSGSNGWAVAREHTTDGVEVRKERDVTVNLPHAESMRRRERSRAAVEPHDPTTASVSNHLELVTDYGDEAVRVVAENRIGDPVTAVETRVEVGDATVFEERWVR